jgi:hypothetical protein
MSAIHTTIKLAVVTTLMLAAVVACGRKDEVLAGKPGVTTTSAATLTPRASCNMLAELGTCNEYRGTSFGLEKSLCEGFHGKFANAGCSTEGQIGTCAMSEGEVKRYYGSKVAGDHALNVEEAKGDCESELVKGKFTMDPNAAAANLSAAEDPAAKPLPLKAVLKKK